MYRATIRLTQRLPQPSTVRAASAQFISTSHPQLADSQATPSAQQPDTTKPDRQAHQKDTGKKTMAQQDQELMDKMKGLSGDGGEAGVEYEDGQPADMKRSVKNNMFRYI